MKYLITGASGQLGFDIKRELLLRGVSKSDIFTPSSHELDITNSNAVNTYLQNTHPDVIFHCAAYTNVDDAESDSITCVKVNVEGTENLATAAQHIESKFIYLSTDYVFKGDSPEPYEIDAPTSPQNVYGRTKLDGERAVGKIPRHFIVRTSWLFGINGHNFVRTMLKLSDSRPQIPVVNDQVGSPTYSRDLAKFLIELSSTEKYGTHHATNEGFCAWSDFATEIFRLTDRKTQVIPVSTAEYAKLMNRPTAKRPRCSKLSKSSLTANGFDLLPTWQNALARYVDELRNGGKL